MVAGRTRMPIKTMPWRLLTNKTKTERELPADALGGANELDEEEWH